jgi:hypothetical protein
MNHFLHVITSDTLLNQADTGRVSMKKMVSYDKTPFPNFTMSMVVYL